MADLGIEMAGLRLPNPILPGAGPLAGNGEQAASVAASGAGGVVTRTGSVQPAPGGPAYAEVRGGVLNVPRWSELPLEQWMDVEYPRARTAASAAGVPLIISLGYTAD